MDVKSITSKEKKQTKNELKQAEKDKKAEEMQKWIGDEILKVTLQQLEQQKKSLEIPEVRSLNVNRSNNKGCRN